MPNTIGILPPSLLCLSTVSGQIPFTGKPGPSPGHAFLFSLYFDMRFFVRRAGVACKARRQDASATFADSFRRSSTDYASS